MPNRQEKGIAVIASRPSQPDNVAKEIAGLVNDLLKSGKVSDPNKIAFLFPSLRSEQTKRMREALEEKGLQVYAPRARSFLEVPESEDVFGLIFEVFGFTDHHHTGFRNWLALLKTRTATLLKEDLNLKRFIQQRRSETLEAVRDFASLSGVLRSQHWTEHDIYTPASMQATLANAQGLSDKAKKAINSGVFKHFAEDRLANGRPFTLKYAITRATSLDWNMLDLFYQLCGFKPFKEMFDLAEKHGDEGPICNMSLISQYLARYTDEYSFPISGEWIGSGTFLNVFTNYLYILFRRQESEYEDAEDPFPKGRIPFITIHQSKGLEFPVVVLANPRKNEALQPLEKLVAPLLRHQSEPLGRMPTFDVMRMFYVSLSRAKDLLVLAHFKGQGQHLNEPFNDFLDNNITRIPQFKVSSMPPPDPEDDPIPQSYSYTGDFLLYRNCPRQYMIFRKYGFVPSRSQTMFFGSLVHQTLEDLHQQ